MQTSAKPYLAADSISISGAAGEVGSIVKCFSCFGYFRVICYSLREIRVSHSGVTEV
jgi:hypothetical protein